MATITLTVNGVARRADVSPDTPLLWVLRDALGLTGTKFGCGMSLCGACTVHVNGEAVRSCATPVSSVTGKKIITIEGLFADPKHPLRQAWLVEDVAQCGYCQPGMLMTAAALLARKRQPPDVEIQEAFRGHICRCGTYHRIRRAMHRATGGTAPPR
jgi:aerobic-type carbon monoxide dehydrogenase small subunit (CoxS/CutS family)